MAKIIALMPPSDAAAPQPVVLADEISLGHNRGMPDNIIAETTLMVITRLTSRTGWADMIALAPSAEREQASLKSHVGMKQVA
jgi:hypothetical protein